MTASNRFTKSLIQGVRSLQNKVYRYSKTVSWITHDSVFRYRFRFILVILLSFFYTGFQIQAIGLAIYYSKLIQKGRDLSFLNFYFEARTSFALLILFSFAISFSLLIAAFVKFFVETQILKLWRMYEEFCAKRAFKLISIKPDKVLNKYQSDSDLLRIIQTDCRYCGRIFGMILRLSIPLISFILSCFVLAYINFWLSSLLGSLLLVVALFLYRINLRGLSYSKLMHTYSPSGRAEYRNILNWLQKFSHRPDDFSEWVDARLFQTSSSNRYQNSFFGRLGVIYESEFISNIFLSISITAIVAILGFNIISNAEGWERLVIYVIAARECLRNFRVVSQKVTSINRFYDHVDRYSSFVNSFSKDNQEIDLIDHKFTTYHADSERNFKIASFIQPYSLDMASAYGVVKKLIFQSDQAYVNVNQQSDRYAMVTVDYKPLPNSKVANWSGIANRSDYKRFLESLGLDEALTKMIFDETTAVVFQRLVSESWEKVSHRERFWLSLVSALHMAAQWILIDEKSFRALDAELRKTILRSLVSHKVVVVFTDQNWQNLGEYCESLVAIQGRDNLVDAGSVEWFLSQSKIFAQEFKDYQLSIRQLKYANSEDEDDDDDLM